MKRVLKEMQEELSSARLIIRLLQADGNITGIDTAANQETNHDSRNNKFKDWKLVSDSKVRANRTTPVQQPQPHPIPTIINRYAVLDNLHNNSQSQQQCEYINTLLSPKEGCDRVTDRACASQQTKRKYKYNMETSSMKQNKIIIMGDSHARGCAQEVQHNLGCCFEVHGFVKPGANAQMIVNTSTKTMGKLTKKDVVVVWGGTRDVGKNETDKGLRQIRNFVENHKQTNVIVMSVPYRHDLESSSCVNHEVKVYNRKLKKNLKLFDNRCVLEVDTDRELYTRHGLHMNLKGKERIACKIAETIKDMINKKMSVPIRMKHKEDLGRENKETEGETITMETETNQEISKKNSQFNTETKDKTMGTLTLDILGNRSSTRQRKTPKSLTDDFLW